MRPRLAGTCSRPRSTLLNSGTTRDTLGCGNSYPTGPMSKVLLSAFSGFSPVVFSIPFPHTRTSHTGVLADPAHCQTNCGKLFAKFSLCRIRVGKSSRRLTPDQVALEMERGFGKIGEIVDGIGPWAMGVEEIAVFNRLITSVKIPRTKGGRLKPPLIPVNVGRMKMNS